MIISGIWELNRNTNTWRLKQELDVWAPVDELAREWRKSIESINVMDLCDEGIQQFFASEIRDSEEIELTISSEPPSDGTLWFFIKERYHAGAYEWVVDAGESDQSPWPFSVDKALSNFGQQRYYLWCKPRRLAETDELEAQRVDPPVQARVVIESVQLTISAREARRIYDRLHEECPVELLPLYNAVASLREVLADQED